MESIDAFTVSEVLSVRRGVRWPMTTSVASTFFTAICGPPPTVKFELMSDIYLPFFLPLMGNGLPAGVGFTRAGDGLLFMVCPFEKCDYSLLAWVPMLPLPFVVSSGFSLAAYNLF